MQLVYLVIGRDTKALREHKVSKENQVHRELMGCQDFQGEMGGMVVRGRKVSNILTLYRKCSLLLAPTF
jgi:hypothetical protein